ncbi:MAG: cold shock CspA family protein [Candidatus Paceibacteria bacterium]|jgi:cold shock CspA family protein
MEVDMSILSGSVVTYSDNKSCGFMSRLDGKDILVPNRFVKHLGLDRLAFGMVLEIELDDTGDKCMSVISAQMPVADEIGRIVGNPLGKKFGFVRPTIGGPDSIFYTADLNFVLTNGDEVIYHAALRPGWQYKAIQIQKV